MHNHPYFPLNQQLSKANTSPIDLPVYVLLLSVVFVAAEYHCPSFRLLFLIAAFHDEFSPDQVPVSLIPETLHLSESATPESVR